METGRNPAARVSLDSETSRVQCTFVCRPFRIVLVQAVLDYTGVNDHNYEQ